MRSVQASLFEAPLHPFKHPLTFFYRYTSGGKDHTQSIQDWEVQATYLSYLKRWRARRALKMMAQEYGENIAFHHGKFKCEVHCRLRSGLELDKQGSLL